MTVFHHDLTSGAVEHRSSDFHETHAAHADRLEFGMMAEDWDVDACHFRRIHDQSSLWYGDLRSIDSERDLFRHEGSALRLYRFLEILRESFDAGHDSHGGEFA